MTLDTLIKKALHEDAKRETATTADMLANMSNVLLKYYHSIESFEECFSDEGGSFVVKKLRDTDAEDGNYVVVENLRDTSITIYPEFGRYVTIPASSYRLVNDARTINSILREMYECIF